VSAPAFHWLVIIGFVAQLIDGCAGMGYGISSSTMLGMLGIPPPMTSAVVHTAEVVTAGVSGASHAWFRNIDKRLFFSLVVTGVIGGIAGARVVTHVPTRIIRPLVWFYLLLTSLFVLGRVILKRTPVMPKAQSPWLGGIAGFLDAVGGGGWGTIVTSTMIARGVPPRYAIGTANAVVFFVAFSVALTLWLQIGFAHYDMVLGLLIGGAAAAPFAAWATRHVPHRVAAVGVGVLVFILGASGLYRTLT
jgi:uncharacterized protein